MSRFVRTLLVVCGVLAVGASVAWATGLTRLGFVGSGGSITACVDNSNGNVRFIDPSSPNKNLNACKKNETQVAVGSPSGPASVTVDCSQGQTVTQALQNTANATSVTVTVDGTCTEDVTIANRDNVTLDAGSSGSGLNGQLNLDDARNVSVQGLALGSFGAGDDSVASLANVPVNNCEKIGVSADTNSSVQVQGGSITGCVFGVAASGGAHIELDNVSVANATNSGVISGLAGAGGDGGGIVTMFGGTVSDNRVGVTAEHGGSVDLQTTTVSGSAASGVVADMGGSVWIGYGATISGNTGASYMGGGVAGYGGRISIGQNAVVENNTGDGVFLSGGSSLILTGPAVTISGNTGDGIYLQDTSVAQVPPPTQITGNGGWGIRCAGPPSVSMIEGTFHTLPAVTGNTAGNIDCQEAS